MERAEQTIMADEQIVELYFQRNESAIEETERKYGRYLFRIAYHILHDELDAEECKNDTYLGVWNAIPPTRPTVFQAFITQIMRFIATDRYRKKMSKKRIPSELTVSMEELSHILHDGGDTALTYEEKEVGRFISDYLRTLTKRERYIFVGRYYIADPVDVIAEELSLSLPTVYRALEKIKKGLRHYLEENGVYL